MSFALSHKVLESSYQSSKKSSGRVVDPTARIRLLFPGGWGNKDSAVFRWHDVQPCKFFRKIQYYKEQQGVGHEFVVLRLKDYHGPPTNWFCRLERMADPAQQLAAIGADGTEAFDYIQSFDSDLLSPLRGAGLVAEITLPRDFDLYDVLAISSAIQEHPRARRYTLQQYNCYFFSWAVILSLARQAVDWEGNFLRRNDDIRASILQSVAEPIPAGQAKLAHTFSFAYGSNTDPTQSILCSVLTDELSSRRFTASAHKALSSLLWVHDGRAKLKNSLQSRSQALAERTIELLIGGLDVNPDAKTHGELGGKINLMPGFDLQELALEGALIFDRTYNSIVVTQAQEECQRLNRNYANNRIEQDSNQLLQGKTVIRTTLRSITPFLCAGLMLTQGIPDAIGTAILQNRIAVHQKQHKGIRALKYVSNTIQNLPRSLRLVSKSVSVVMSSSIMELKGGYDPSDATVESCVLRALELTIATLLPKLPNQDDRLVRALAFTLIVTISEATAPLKALSPKQIWEHLLWDFIGDIIAGVMFEIPPTIKDSLSGEPEFEFTPTVQLQQFIEERIVRLSKHDIDHAPIIKHIPVPAMAPPLKSQRQMKDALENIWRTANVGTRFKALEVGKIMQHQRTPPSHSRCPILKMPDFSIRGLTDSPGIWPLFDSE